MSRRMNRVALLCSRTAACCLDNATQWRQISSSSARTSGLAQLLQRTRMEPAGSAQQAVHGPTHAFTSAASAQAGPSAAGWGCAAAAAAAAAAGRAWQQQQLQSRRTFCEGGLRTIHAEISENEYHRLADEALDKLQERLEGFIEDLDVAGGDVEQAQGVLTVKLGSHGTYVINKQTPNRQIWLSSPLTGPFRYDYHEGRWLYARTGAELFAQLQQELQQLLGSAPDLS